MSFWSTCILQYMCCIDRMESCRQLVMMIHRLFFSSTFPLYFLHPITLPNPITLPSTLSSSPSTHESQSSSPPCSPFSTPSLPLGWSTSYHRRSCFPSPIPFPVADPVTCAVANPVSHTVANPIPCTAVDPIPLMTADTAQVQMISLKSVSCLIPCYVRAAFDIVHQPECSSFR